MSDFLTRLVERTQGVAQVAQPIIAPMFAQMPTNLSDYSQNSTQDNQPLNAPNRAIFTAPPDDLSSATPNQSFHKKSNTIFSPAKHVESDLSEQVEAVFPQLTNDQIEHGIIEHSSNLMSSKDFTNRKRQRENFFGNNESQTNTRVSEYDPNTSLPNEHSHGARRDVPGRLIVPGQVNVLRNLPEAERDQSTGTQLKHPLNEKRDESGALIKSEYVSELQEIAESEHYQNINLQPEHPLNEKHEAFGEPVYFDETSALRKQTEVQSTETSYLKPSSQGKIRFRQAAEPEPSSAEPTIKVTIGRVEVRAIIPSAPIAPASHARTRNPTLSLNDYLKQRNEGRR
ncbi:MAG: hypothetical protein SCH70_01000 [Candidatus Methanoperedens sp.]|nr:hypothetical protein [Candidatus Methanoperedens sp.]